MDPANVQRTTNGRRLMRAAVVGVLFGLFGFIYFPVWVGAVFLTLGALIGLAASVADDAFGGRR